MANNGLAAVKFISYLRRWANNTFGHDRMVRPGSQGLVTCCMMVHCVCMLDMHLSQQSSACPARACPSCSNTFGHDCMVRPQAS